MMDGVVLDSGQSLARWHLGRVSPTPLRVPKAWQLVRLTSVARLESGHTPSRSQPTYWQGDIPWISLHDTGGLDVAEICSTAQTISRVGLEHSSARLLPRGTVVFSRTATVGKSTVMGREMATSQDFANYVCGPRLHNHYLVHLFRFMRPEWERLMAGSTHNSIYMPVFEQLQVLLPPIREQEGIAGALSDADVLIESLEQLLAKKRHLKEGAMQELLTGKRRLPGFTDDWTSLSFDRVLSRLNAKAHQIQTSGYQSTGRYPIVDQGKERVAGYSDRSDKRFRCVEGGVIVFGDHTCVVKFVDFDFVVGADGTQILVAKDGHHTRFLALQLQYRGIPSTGYNRHFRFLKEREFRVPTPLEQSAIAAVLRDVESEIAALEAKLTKARQIKQGMMQELLTGRIRLV